MFKKHHPVNDKNNNIEHAFIFCGRSISFKFQGESLLRKKLADRCYSPDVIDGAITLCRDYGYLNDRRLADMVAENLLSSGRGAGMRVRQKLQRLGVGADDIAAALAAQSEEIDVVGALSDNISRKYPDFDPAQRDPKALQRVCGHYQRKGYSWTQISGAFKRMAQGE